MNGVDRRGGTLQQQGNLGSIDRSVAWVSASAEVSQCLPNKQTPERTIGEVRGVGSIASCSALVGVRTNSPAGRRRRCRSCGSSECAASDTMTPEKRQAAESRTRKEGAVKGNDGWGLSGFWFSLHPCVGKDAEQAGQRPKCNSRSCNRPSSKRIPHRPSHSWKQEQHGIALCRLCSPLLALSTGSVRHLPAIGPVTCCNVLQHRPAPTTSCSLLSACSALSFK